MRPSIILAATILAAGCAAPLDAAHRTLAAIGDPSRLSPAIEQERQAAEIACGVAASPDAASACMEAVRTDWVPVNKALRAARLSWVAAEAALRVADVGPARGDPPDPAELAHAVELVERAARDAKVAKDEIAKLRASYPPGPSARP